MPDDVGKATNSKRSANNLDFLDRACLVCDYIQEEPFQLCLLGWVGNVDLEIVQSFNGTFGCSFVPKALHAAGSRRIRRHGVRISIQGKIVFSQSSAKRKSPWLFSGGIGNVSNCAMKEQCMLVNVNVWIAFVW